MHSTKTGDQDDRACQSLALADAIVAKKCQSIEEIRMRDGSTAYRPIMAGGENPKTPLFQSLQAASLAGDIIAIKKKFDAAEHPLNSIEGHVPTLIHSWEWLRSLPIVKTLMKENNLEAVIGLLQTDDSLTEHFPGSEEARTRIPTITRIYQDDHTGGSGKEVSLNVGLTNAVNAAHDFKHNDEQEIQVCHPSCHQPVFRPESCANDALKRRSVSDGREEADEEAAEPQVKPDPRARAPRARRQHTIAISGSSSSETHSSDLLPVRRNERSGSLSPSSKVRTNWGSVPDGGGAQALALTRAQIAGGCFSVPKARCINIFGLNESGCVKIIDKDSGKAWEISHRMYSSQPTQVFLQGLKKCFDEISAKAGDVLQFEPAEPGVARIKLYAASAPEANAFYSNLRHAWTASPKTSPNAAAHKSTKENLEQTSLATSAPSPSQGQQAPPSEDSQSIDENDATSYMTSDEESSLMEDEWKELCSKHKPTTRTLRSQQQQLCSQDTFQQGKALSGRNSRFHFKKQKVQDSTCSHARGTHATQHGRHIFSYQQRASSSSSFCFRGPDSTRRNRGLFHEAHDLPKPDRRSLAKKPKGRTSIVCENSVSGSASRPYGTSAAAAPETGRRKQAAAKQGLHTRSKHHRYFTEVYNSRRKQRYPCQSHAGDPDLFSYGYAVVLADRQMLQRKMQS